MNTAEENTLNSLIEALAFSPDNVPLRKHIATLLFQMGRLEEAEQHFQEAIALAPDQTELKLKLAEIFRLRQKQSAAFVVIEELLQKDSTNAQAQLLHARLLSDTHEAAEALEKYRLAVRLDPGLKDTALETALMEQAHPGLNETGLKVPAMVHAPGSEGLAEVEKPKIKFADVGGMDNVKQEIGLKIIHPLQHPEIYKAYGKKTGGGILLYGPPGCGKTHLARATAGEINATFMSVGISEILDMWLGNSEKNLHQIFEVARAHAPCVLFFDEVDALGANRNDMRHSGGRQLINQFLSELDGLDHSNEGVLILAATNAPWSMDPAFRRPGRFDRIILVSPPDEKARETILELLLREKPAGRINFSSLGKKTKEFSGADLKAVVDVAVESKLMESMRSGKAMPIEQPDLEKAISRVRPSTKEWFGTARNYALYANESGIYDEILSYLNIRK